MDGVLLASGTVFFFWWLTGKTGVRRDLERARARVPRTRSACNPMGVVGLDHVQVAAPRGCEAQAWRFYGELVGLVEIEKPEPLRERDPLVDVRRFYSQDRWGNRIELLST